MKLTTFPIKLCTLAIALSLLTACGGKVNPQNFDKVQTQMSKAEVKKLLGEPTLVETTTLPLVGEVTMFSYSTDKGEVTVIFHNDRVQTKTGSLNQ